MSRLLLLFALAFAGAVSANPSQPTATTIEVCTQVGLVAETVMLHRQTVASKPATIELMLDQLQRDGQSRNRDLIIVVGHIIDTAYEVPHHKSDRQQASREVMMFKLYWASMCINSEGK